MDFCRENRLVPGRWFFREVICRSLAGDLPRKIVWLLVGGEFLDQLNAVGKSGACEVCSHEVCSSAS